MNKKAASLLLAVMLVISFLTACGGSGSAPAATAAPTEAPTSAPTEAPTEAPSATDVPAPSNVASGADTIEYEDVTEEGMVPVGPEFIKDGEYEVEMKSSSAMFKADHCVLTVIGNEMYVTLYMTSEAYLYMFAGTANDAAVAPESDYISLEPSDQEGFKQFVLPLKALDDGEPFAAFSKKKELWYDRTLLFKAASLPVEAFEDGYLTTAESLGLADGEYTVDVTLSGGTGKASVSSPARLTVTNGECVAELIWSSSKYDYVRIGEDKYLPVNTEGNSTFLVPFTYFDYSMQIMADTTAMSQPHEIEYSIRFDSASVQPAS